MSPASSHRLAMGPLEQSSGLRASRAGLASLSTHLIHMYGEIESERYYHILGPETGAAPFPV